MRISKIAALAAVTAALGLAACGGGGSEFKTKMTETCEKEGGDLPGVGKVDCGCAVAIMDAEFPADLKDFVLKMMAAQENPEAMKDLDPTVLMSKMEEFQKQGQKIEERVKAECKKG